MLRIGRGTEIAAVERMLRGEKKVSGGGGWVERELALMFRFV
jgi:hypothetical protein